MRCLWLLALAVPLGACSAPGAPGGDGRRTPQQCAAASSCACGGPKDCPAGWVCAVVAPGEAYCASPAGTACERQMECSAGDSCQGLDCSLGTGAAGCGLGVCLEKLSVACKSSGDCPRSSDLCVAPGAANLANALCYR